MGADVVAGGDVVVGELRDRFAGGVVLIDMPVGLLGIVVGEVLHERQAQREDDFRPIGRDIEVAHRALAVREGGGDVHLGGCGARRVAYVQVAPGDRGDEIAYVDVVGRGSLVFFVWIGRGHR